MYLLKVAVPPSPGRVPIPVATQPLQQKSQSEPRREHGRSSYVFPCHHWEHTARPQRPRENNPSKQSLPSFPRLSLPLQPCSTSAALPVCSRQGVLLPNPSSLQDFGCQVWWEFCAQQDLWQQIALALCYREQD